MKNIIIETIYPSLISVVPSTIAILVPLVGAFWIFKVGEKTVAEGKIFEFGREIANILQSKEIRGPIDGVSYYYIDKVLHKIKEKNRGRALKELLRENLYFYNPADEFSAERNQDAANIVVAVVTERVNSLVPETVKWSGRGVVYNAHGEDIETKDNYFPFGTKLYREWVENFGAIYNDLWAVTNSRRSFIEHFLSEGNWGGKNVDQKFVTNWLEDISTRIRGIHPIHAKLLTQIQIIDTQIDLPRLEKDIGYIALYGFLLTCSGFLAPKILYLADLLSLGAILKLTMAVFLSYVLVFMRLISGGKPAKEKNIQRDIFIPVLINNLKAMEKECMEYKSHIINNILSLDSELKLSSSIKRTLTELVRKMEIFNEYSAMLYSKEEEIINSLKIEFSTQEKNTQSFGINTNDLANKEFSLDDVKSRVLKEECNFIFSYQEAHSSRDILTVNLADLDRGKRLALCDSLEDLRSSINNLPLYKTTAVALTELQNIRASALSQVEKTYNKSSKQTS